MVQNYMTLNAAFGVQHEIQITFHPTTDCTKLSLLASYGSSVSSIEMENNDCHKINPLKMSIPVQ